MFKTSAKAVPVIQVSNVLKDKYTRRSTAYTAARRIVEDFRNQKEEGKNYVRVFGPDGCFVLCEVKSNGKLTANGLRLREAFLNGYK